MDYKANYGRRYYVESTAYDFDMFTDKKKSATNVVDFKDMTQEYVYADRYGTGIILAGGGAGIGRYTLPKNN